MSFDVKWREAAEKAEAYKAIGETTIHLYRDTGEPPWEFVTRAEPGGSWRNDIPVGVSFEADHPCGLTFVWSWDLETFDANGKSGYHIDAARVAATRERLTGTPALDGFLAYLQRAADAIQKQADQALGFALGQYGQERLVRALINPPSPEEMDR